MNFGKELTHYEFANHLQIHGLENQVCRRRKLDDLSGRETELLIVIQHRVHVLDPKCVHRAVEDQPLPVWINRSGECSVGHRQDTVAPLVRRGIELAIQLAHRDGLGIDDGDLHAMLVHQLPVLQETETVRQHSISRGLATEWQSDDHKAVAHDHHLVDLLDLLQEMIRALQICRSARIPRARVDVRIIWRRQHDAGKQIRSYS